MTTPAVPPLVGRTADWVDLFIDQLILAGRDRFTVQDLKPWLDSVTGRSWSWHDASMALQAHRRAQGNGRNPTRHILERNGMGSGGVWIVAQPGDALGIARRIAREGAERIRQDMMLRAEPCARRDPAVLASVDAHFRLIEASMEVIAHALGIGSTSAP